MFFNDGNYIVWIDSIDNILLYWRSNLMRDFIDKCLIYCNIVGLYNLSKYSIIYLHSDNLFIYSIACNLLKTDTNPYKFYNWLSNI